MINKRKELTLMSTICRNDMYNGSQEGKKKEDPGLGGVYWRGKV